MSRLDEGAPLGHARRAAMTALCDGHGGGISRSALACRRHALAAVVATVADVRGALVERRASEVLGSSEPRRVAESVSAWQPTEISVVDATPLSIPKNVSKTSKAWIHQISIHLVLGYRRLRGRTSESTRRGQRRAGVG